mmetsp:Transcript_19355/g.22189  ORF Transcript_19355/g.22189 Transcript_19355/m.22189 type:complete len:216 (+) Transcript_19355:2-649(+)|eukprot:CAMPEP_0176439944 /NCGR_PEP_ID=MMETSP0127-20121128/20267_1 /TAXON_ID=938130 /ORGANISM="Platyophrya macrostoma, Strain WH" /LENGTH=215 /DNA_ID=CAMNT_0017824355 /DNA_START=36 /DNA_END=683 /DNA_ORIENTATION=-
MQQKEVLQEYNKRIAALISKISKKETSNYNLLVELLDDFETEPAILIDDYTEDIAAMHLLSYLLIFDSINGKFLWKRLSSKLKSSTKLKGIFAVFAHIIKDEHEFIMKALDDAVKGFENPYIKQLSDILPGVLRGHLASVIAKNYANIHIKEFSKIVCLSVDDARIYVASLGWKTLEGDYVEPEKKVKMTNDLLHKLSVEQIEQATKTIGFLETI